MSMTFPFAMRPQTEGLTVAGEALRSAPPEIVEIALDLHSAAPSATQALRDNALKTMQVAQTMTTLGVTQNDMQTGVPTVYPLYQAGFPLLPQMTGFAQLPGAGMGAYPPQPGAPAEVPQVIGYHVVNFLKLSLRDVARLGEIVDAATRGGANLSTGLLFRLRDEPAMRRTLLEAAGRDARSKGEALASALGRQLGDPLIVSEDFSAYQVGGPIDGWFRPGAVPVPLGRPAIPAGDLTFQARVSVTYRLQ